MSLSSQTIPSPPRAHDFRPGGFFDRTKATAPEIRTPRIHVGGAYYPKPGWQIIVLDVFRHARGWSVEGMHRFSGSTVVRTDVIGYLEFCRLVGVEP